MGAVVLECESGSLGCSQHCRRRICRVKNFRMCKSSQDVFLDEVFWKPMDVLLFLEGHTAEKSFLLSELNTCLAGEY